MNPLHLACVFLSLTLGDLRGAWSGRLNSPGVSGTVELDFEKAGERWRGDGVFRSGPDEVRSTLADVESDGASLAFSASIEGASVLFQGKIDGDAITGEFQVRENGRTIDEGTWSATRGAAPAPEAIPDDARIDARETESVVSAIADVLRKRYVDAALGEAMARAIDAKQKAGAYRSIGDARMLADQLGRDLFEVAHDKHLKIRFSREPLPPDSADAPESPADREALRNAYRTENFGFRKVEILAGNVGLLDLSRFVRADLAGEAAATAMGFLQNCDALIVDLRSCAGGDPAMVAFLASWLFDGTPTRVADMYRREDDLTVQWWTSAWVPHRRLTAAPVCVLTASRTFSAAEALAFHLQKLGRAEIVGERTAGGAHPSRRVRLTERFSITVPTSRSFDPETKLDWENVGVQPDVEAPAGDALRVAHARLLGRLADAQGDQARARELREIRETVERAR